MAEILKSTAFRRQVLEMANLVRPRNLMAKSGRKCDMPARVAKLTLADLGKAPRFTFDTK